MHVSGLGAVSRANAQAVRPSSAAKAETPPAAVNGDTVEISAAARLSADAPHEANSLRARRLEEIQQMIENGTYETTERLEAALSRFLAVAVAQP